MQYYFLWVKLKKGDDQNDLAFREGFWNGRNLADSLSGKRMPQVTFANLGSIITKLTSDGEVVDEVKMIHDSGRW